jgi:hypothetical protein
MAHGIGLVFPEKRKAHVYRKLSAWHDYSATTFHYCLYRLNDPMLLANPEVPKVGHPTCLFGRQKRLGNGRKKKYF